VNFDLWERGTGLDLLPFVPGICASVEPLGSWNEFPGPSAQIIATGCIKLLDYYCCGCSLGDAPPKESTGCGALLKQARYDLIHVSTTTTYVPLLFP
jgi:hypothetical protein